MAGLNRENGVAGPRMSVRDSDDPPAHRSAFGDGALAAGNRAETWTSFCR